MVALTQADLAAVRSIKSPTTTLKLNLEVMCLYKNIKPDRIPDPSGGGGSTHFSIYCYDCVDNFFLNNMLN
jgi:hypothetical protein